MWLTVVRSTIRMWDRLRMNAPVVSRTNIDGDGSDPQHASSARQEPPGTTAVRLRTPGPTGKASIAVSTLVDQSRKIYKNHYKYRR